LIAQSSLVLIAPRHMKSLRPGLSVVLFALLAINGWTATLYVDLNSTNPAPPYADWNNAATNIQDAVDASTNGDLILVTNGVYEGGIVVTNAITIQSVNGADATSIDGNQVASCANLTDGASLSGFTLTNGMANYGGGVLCQSTNAVISNCVLIDNLAVHQGGGVYSGTLWNCALVLNKVQSSSAYGGGAYNSTLNNCTLVSNTLRGNKINAATILPFKRRKICFAALSVLHSFRFHSETVLQKNISRRGTHHDRVFSRQHFLSVCVPILIVNLCAIQ